METYPVDLEASQIVRLRGRLQLNVTATHSYVVEALEKADLDQIGEEGEELNDILAIGMLEVSPPAGKNGERSFSPPLSAPTVKISRAARAD